MRKYRIKIMMDYTQSYRWRLERNDGTSFDPRWTFINMYDTEDAALRAMHFIANIDKHYPDGERYFDDQGNPIS